MILGTDRTAAKYLTLMLVCGLLAGCSTTSGSARLDSTGERIAGIGEEPAEEPASPAYYLQALRGGLVGRMPGVKLSRSDRIRALEAEYKALESAPAGQKLAWEGADGTRGEVLAATPYTVGSQNCRQYTHAISVKGGMAQTARGAACRNPNGSWTPLI